MLAELSMPLTYSAAPAEITAAFAVPPDWTARISPASTVVELATPPDCTASTELVFDSVTLLV